MGWTFPYTAPEDPKADIDAGLTWSSESGTRRVLKSSMVGTTYYAAVEWIKPDGERVVRAAIYLTQRHKGQWGYKDMDETMGPNESRCPASILALLTPTGSQWANEWRKRCRANLEAKRNRLPWQAGDVVQYGPHQYRLTSSAGPRKGWVVHRVSDGCRFRMPFSQLSQATRVKEDNHATA